MTSKPTSDRRQRTRIQREIVNTLARTRLLRATTSRMLLVEELSDRLESFPTTEHAQVRLQIIEIVRSCVQMDAVDLLVEVVDYLEPETAETAQLWRLLDEWEAVDVLAVDDWSDLRSSLEALVPANIAWLYQQATGHRVPVPPVWCTDAWTAFVHLAGQNAEPDGLSPSMVFLVFLEREADSKTAHRIRDRNRREAAAQELTKELEVRRVRADRGPDPVIDTTAYLVLQMEPDLDPGASDEVEPEEKYLVSYVRQWRGPDSWLSRPGPAVSTPASGLEKRVEQVINQMETEWRHRTGTVVIEFVLPWELLNAEVDWWRKELASARPTALTMDYPMVIRSLERMRTVRWHRPWLRRWKQLLQAPASSRSYVSRPDDDDYFTRLEAELKSDDQVVSLVLSEPPRRSGHVGRQEVEVALRAGLPVIIWHRSDCTSSDFHEAVTNLMSDGGLAQLPERAKQLRVQALRLKPELRESHVGRHLTVLWDDPERTPDLGGPSGGTVGETR